MNTQIDAGYGFEMVKLGEELLDSYEFYDHAENQWKCWNNFGGIILGRATAPFRRPIPIPEGMELVPEDEARKFDGFKVDKIRVLFRDEVSFRHIDCPTFRDNAAAFIRPKSTVVPKADHADHAALIESGWVRTLDRLPDHSRPMDWFYYDFGTRRGNRNALGEWQTDGSTFPAPDYWREIGEPYCAWIKTADRLPDANHPIWITDNSRHVRLMERGSKTPEGLLINGWTHWQPATIPKPPEPEMDEAEKAWLAEPPMPTCASAKSVYILGFNAAKKGAV